jgi:hypothetical protein
MKILCKALSEQMLFLYTVLLTVFTYIQDSYYIPRGLRTMYTDALRGSHLTNSLLTGHPLRIQNLTRVKRETFVVLL